MKSRCQRRKGIGAAGRNQATSETPLRALSSKSAPFLSFELAASFGSDFAALVAKEDFTDCLARRLLQDCFGFVGSHYSLLLHVTNFNSS